MSLRVLEGLAVRFPSLYVAPHEDALATWRQAALKGIPPANARLDHFMGTEMEELTVADTPAGPVEVIFLRERSDFENFLRCTIHRSQPVKIAPTIGASTITGLADWAKIRAELTRAREAGEDTREAFRAFVATGAHLTTLVLISWGPYSALPSEDTPYGTGEWLEVSRTIRTYHELAHVVCRHLMPDDRPPVLDEVTADFCGLLFATGTYDDAFAAKLLGVSETGYVGGRLEEYLDDEQCARIDEVARQVHACCAEIAKRTAGADPASCFELTLDLKRAHLLTY